MLSVQCQWCPDGAEAVPIQMFGEHVQLMHSDVISVMVNALGAPSVDLGEVKAAYAHMSEARRSVKRDDYSMDREYQLVTERLEFLSEEILDLVTIMERFQA